MITKITIEVVPHDSQRYNTVGDWFFRDNELVIRASAVSRNHWYSLAIAYHELTEALLALHSYTVNQHKSYEDAVAEVDYFDHWFEANADSDGKVDGFEEPGEHPSCPIHKEHDIAMLAERLLTSQMDINWEVYSNVLDNIYLARKKQEEGNAQTKR
jgi:hypothetical protein